MQNFALPVARTTITAGVTFCLMILAWLSFIPAARSQQPDTVHLKKSQVLVLRDTIYIPNNDTFLLIDRGTRYKIRSNPYYSSEKLRDSLAGRANRRPLSGGLYRLLFRAPDFGPNNTDSVLRSENYFKAYAGSRIGSIRVVYVPMFEGNVADTIPFEPSGFTRLLETLHTRTRASLIRNNLLFKVGDEVDPFIIADGERSIRSFSFIEDARIYLAKDTADSAAVHVTVVVKDRFPWSIELDVQSGSRYTIGLINSNFTGTGNQAATRYVYNNKEQFIRGFDLSFVSQKIGRSLAHIELDWANNWQEQKLSVRLIKNFISPTIRYGGEIDIGEWTHQVRQIYLDSSLLFNVSYKYSDIWLGRAFQLRSPGNRKTLFLGFRYLHNKFLQRPYVDHGFNIRFHNRDFILASISYQKINYLKTRYILSYGITEDVPVGFVYGISYGRDAGEFQKNNYLGFQAAWANYFPRLGYFSMNHIAGTFFDAGRFQNSVWRSGIKYFSPLLKLRQSRIRNFLDFNLGIGDNLTPPETLNLDQFIDRFRSNLAHGTSYYSIHLESSWFTPWYLYNFRFAPFITFDYGSVSEKRDNFSANIAGIGGGIRIRNESLTIRTVALGFTYFPHTLPDSPAFSVNINFSTPEFFSGILLFKPRIATLD